MRNKIVLLLLGLGIILTGTLGLSYALWTYNTSQLTNNILKSECFKLELTDERNNINLQNTIPLTNKEGMKLTPYTLKVSNTCTTVASYNLNLESLASTTLASDKVRLSLNGSTSKLYSEYNLNTDTIITDAIEGRLIDSGVLKAGKSKSYSLRIWLDGSLTNSSDIAGKVFNSKVTVTGILNPDYITVNLDPMGGIIENDTVEQMVGDNYKDLPIPTKEGYYFNYWYLENEDNKVTGRTIVEKNTSHTLKASWLKDDEVTLLKQNAFGNMNNYNAKEIATEIKPYTEKLTEEIINSATEVSDNESLNKAYVWLDNTTLYYKGETDNIYLNVVDCFGTPEAFSGLEYKNVTIIDLSGINTSLLNYCADMFRDCRNLVTVIFPNSNTGKITNCSGMFYNCNSLTSLDLLCFNTSKVTDMSKAFYNCNSLNSLDLSNFNTNNVKYMSEMFNGCKALTSLNLSSFDTNKVTRMYDMFHGCESLTSLDVSSFDTSNVYYMSGMFSGCYELIELDISNFDTSNVEYMERMFAGCSSLTYLDTFGFNTSKVKVMNNMFYKCSGLMRVNVSNFDTSNVTNMSSMFSNCNNLTSIDLSNFNTSKVESMHSMFNNCSSLTNIYLLNFDTSNVTGIGYMFCNCTNITSLDLSSFEIEKVTDIGHLFSGCESLNTLYLKNFHSSIINNNPEVFSNSTKRITVYMNCETTKDFFKNRMNFYNRCDISCI